MSWFSDSLYLNSLLHHAVHILTSWDQWRHLMIGQQDLEASNGMFSEGRCHWAECHGMSSVGWQRDTERLEGVTERRRSGPPLSTSHPDDRYIMNSIMQTVFCSGILPTDVGVCFNNLFNLFDCFYLNTLLSWYNITAAWTFYIFHEFHLKVKYL